MEILVLGVLHDERRKRIERYHVRDVVRRGVLSVLQRSSISTQVGAVKSGLVRMLTSTTYAHTT
jgi:hypothetical protein